MIIILSRRGTRNELELENHELVGEYDIVIDDEDAFSITFTDNHTFFISYDDMSVEIWQNGERIYHGNTHSRRFLEDVVEEIREGFPRFAVYTDEEEVNSNATLSNSNISNISNISNTSRLSVRSGRSRRQRRSRRLSRRISRRSRN